jgi:hypothetical protein
VCIVASAAAVGKQSNGDRGQQDGRCFLCLVFIGSKDNHHTLCVCVTSGGRAAGVALQRPSVEHNAGTLGPSRIAIRLRCNAVELLHKF